MAGNLPDDVKSEDIGYPYGSEPNPEPEGYCPHCREPYGDDIEYVSFGMQDGLRWINHGLCPSCNEVVKAHLVDATKAYLISWRTIPDEMERTIGRYSELREIDEVND